MRKFGFGYIIEVIKHERIRGEFHDNQVFNNTIVFTITLNNTRENNN